MQSHTSSGSTLRTKSSVSCNVSFVSPGYPKMTDTVTNMPASLVHLIAFSHCSFEIFFFSMSRILWHPDSTPHIVSLQCALLILAKTSLLTTSARVPQPHGRLIFLSIMPSQISSARFLSNVNVSSWNAIPSAPYSSLNHSNSSNTFLG